MVMVDSYDGDLSDSKDWIRFTLQDTDSTDFILSDTEINSALDLRDTAAATTPPDRRCA